MSRAIPLLPLWAFGACYRAIFTFVMQHAVVEKVWKVVCLFLKVNIIYKVMMMMMMIRQLFTETDPEPEKERETGVSHGSQWNASGGKFTMHTTCWRTRTFLPIAVRKCDACKGSLQRPKRAEELRKLHQSVWNSWRGTWRHVQHTADIRGSLAGLWTCIINNESNPENEVSFITVERRMSVATQCCHSWIFEAEMSAESSFSCCYRGHLVTSRIETLKMRLDLSWWQDSQSDRLHSGR
jgi:hypothetical protein